MFKFKNKKTNEVKTAYAFARRGNEFIFGFLLKERNMDISKAMLKS